MWSIDRSRDTARWPRSINQIDYYVPPQAQTYSRLDVQTLQDLPTDVLFLIMDRLLPSWALVATTPRGPTWTVDDMTAPLDIALAADRFYALALVSHRMRTIATPYLYRIIHVRDARTLVALWATLAALRPSNAAHVRHLLFGIPLHNEALTGYRYCVTFEVITTARAFTARGQRLRWADGKLLGPRTRDIDQRICFDIATRCIHVQSLGVLPPSPWDVNRAFGFRQALDTVASASLLGPTRVVLDRLRVVTLQIRNSCRKYLSVYGILRLPLLMRLNLMSEPESWFLGLHDRTEGDRSTILEKVKTLTVIPGRCSPAVNSDLSVDFASLPHLEDLALFPHPKFLGRCYIWATLAPPADLNPQLAQHAPGLRCLDVSWRLEPDSPVWPHLGPARRLACLPRLRNLVQLQISTQVLFGSLARLQKLLRLRPTTAAAAAASARPHGEEAYQYHMECQQRLAKLLGGLPESLQILTLTEWWPATERGLFDVFCAITQDTWHGQGDWMEARYQDEAASSQEFPATAAAAAQPRSLENMIHAAHDVATLNLMRVLCQKWLWPKRDARAVELRPQNPYFYRRYTHPTLLATEGLERLLSRREESRHGHETFFYSFVAVVYLQGVGAVVSATRP